MGKAPRKRRRPTLPKTKGCYECSKRRISCDRAEPACQKCVQKGLNCSGLGIRYRFNHGVASRGKLVGKSVSGEELPREEHTPESPVTMGSSIKNRSLMHADAREINTETSNLEPSTEEVADAEEYDGKASQNLRLSIIEILGCLNTRERFLVKYFEENIVPNMIAVDDKSNGYRKLILPATELHSPVLNAVLASSAHHIALKLNYQTEAVNLAEKFYTRAIVELRQLSSNASTEKLGHVPSIITTLVMLICAMITGSSDFPILFKMLESSLKVSDDRSNQGDIPFKDFLDCQMRKFELYASPFLDSERALNKFNDAESLHQGLACLLRCSQLHPEHSYALAEISSLIRIACSIYSLRARNELDHQTSYQLVESFKVTLERHHSDSPGWNVLVWASFIVAAESKTPSHQNFFVSRFKTFYQVTGFGNLRTALEMLHSIWNGDSKGNWTETLPHWQAFIM